MLDHRQTQAYAWKETQAARRAGHPEQRQENENTLLSKWGYDFWKNRLFSPGMVFEALEQLREVLMGAVTRKNDSTEILLFT